VKLIETYFKLTEQVIKHGFMILTSKQCSTYAGSHPKKRNECAAKPK
jgi:hypothetical protein